MVDEKLGGDASSGMSPAGERGQIDPALFPETDLEWLNSYTIPAQATM
jgi:hypothetical protein